MFSVEDVELAEQVAKTFTVDELIEAFSSPVSFAEYVAETNKRMHDIKITKK